MISLRSKITREILSYFFLHEKQSLYVNEMARRFGLDSGNLSRKLSDLEQEGVLTSERRGKEHYYSLNKKFPLAKEYRKIILKTAGIEHLLRGALTALGGVQKAMIYGSYAKNTMTSASDIDVLVVGDHKVVDLHRAISKLQKKTDREINVTSLSSKEYELKRKSDEFFRALSKRPRVELI